MPSASGFAGNLWENRHLFLAIALALGEDNLSFVSVLGAIGHEVPRVCRRPRVPGSPLDERVLRLGKLSAGSGHTQKLGEPQPDHPANPVLGPVRDPPRNDNREPSPAELTGNFAQGLKRFLEFRRREHLGLSRLRFDEVHQRILQSRQIAMLQLSGGGECHQTPISEK